MGLDSRPDGLEEQDDEEIERLLREIEEASADAGRIYEPHAKQKAFHEAPQKVRAVFGGNRSGKTECGTLETRFHSTGDYPAWYPLSQRFSGPTRGRIVVTDYRKGGNEVLEPKIMQWFDPECIQKIERFMGHIVKLHIKHRTGGISTIDVMTHEQDDMAFEGWSGHYVWFDEPPPQNKFIACMRGLVDFDGRAWMTLTPISEPWIYDEIVTATVAEPQRVWFITVDIRDNPYLSEQAIRDFEAHLSPEQKEARIHGKFIHLAGRIYKDFDPEIHCIEKMPAGWTSWPKWFVLDPADRRPHHAIWACVDPMETIYIYDELVYKGTIKETSKEIITRERTNGVDPESVIRILDPNKGRTPSNVTGLRLVEEFATHGVYFTANVNDDIATGHLAVSERLGYDREKPLSSTNAPKMYFLKSGTKECIKQVLSYVWDDWKNQSSRSAKETPKDISKDFPDTLRYLVMSNPIYYSDSGAGRGDDNVARLGFSLGDGAGNGGRTGYGR